MKKTILVIAAVTAVAAFGLEHKIAPDKNGGPSSFVVGKNDVGKVTCAKGADGKAAIKFDAMEKDRRIYSGLSIKIAQGDVLKLKMKIKGSGPVSYGFYTYSNAKQNAFLGAVYKPLQQITPNVAEYSFEGVVQKNPKEKSAFDRPGKALIFIQAKKGSKFDVEKIEYEVVKAKQEKAVIPDF